MNKLIELLNEYEAERHKTSVIADIRKGEDRLSYLEMNWNYSELLCISKRYEFIKRLVNNDKIDRDRTFKENWLFKMYFYDLEYVKNYDKLIMWLSVEDNPIGFLISILK